MSVSPDEVFRGHEPGQAAGRAVSAADVVLYGVNLILPLMSQDLLKVMEDGGHEHSSVCTGGSRRVRTRTCFRLTEGCTLPFVCVHVKWGVGVTLRASLTMSAAQDVGLPQACPRGLCLLHIGSGNCACGR